MSYTKESLKSLCVDILGKVDESQVLPVLVNQAAIALFRCNVSCDSLCGELREALNDLHIYGEFGFANPELINPIQEIGSD